MEGAKSVIPVILEPTPVLEVTENTPEIAISSDSCQQISTNDPILMTYPAANKDKIASATTGKEHVFPALPNSTFKGTNQGY